MNESRQVIVRAFALRPSQIEDRTIVGRCVPYGVAADIPDEGNGPYKEMFQRGAFRNAVKAPHKVLLSFEHETSPLNLLGRGVELIERDDGLHGSFKAFETEVGNQGLAMVQEGVLTGMSVRAAVLSTHRRPDGMVIRTKCMLDHVALCREPAYAGAIVEALRSADPMTEPAALTALRPPRNVELDERIRALRERGLLQSAG